MEQNIIYFVDEDPAARRACGRALRSLLESEDVRIEVCEPYKNIEDYNPLVLKADTGAFILDQRMSTSGFYNYNGIDVANHLRNLNSKIPLYILTGHAEDTDAFEGQNHLVEYILGKEEINDITSPEAITIKARMLRNLKTYNDIRNDRESKFQALLLKSLSEQLTEDEQI